MQEKSNYVSPECEIHEMRLEGVIAASGGLNSPSDYGTGMDPFNS